MTRSGLGRLLEVSDRLRTKRGRNSFTGPMLSFGAALVMLRSAPRRAWRVGLELGWATDGTSTGATARGDGRSRGGRGERLSLLLLRVLGIGFGDWERSHRNGRRGCAE